MNVDVNQIRAACEALGVTPDEFRQLIEVRIWPRRRVVEVYTNAVEPGESIEAKDGAIVAYRRDIEIEIPEGWTP